MVDGIASTQKSKVEEGQVVDVQLPEVVEGEGPVGTKMPLSILFEDEHIIVLNKPIDLVVHPAAGHQEDTLVNGLVHYLGEDFKKVKGGNRPGIVHRLDKDTSGVMVVAKTDEAYESLVEQLSQRKAARTYLAWAWGNFDEQEGTIEAPIGRSPHDRQKMAVVKRGGRDAVTHFTILERGDQAAKLEVRLETGRTHQIRVHLATIKHPVVGDKDYGGAKSPSGDPAPIERQALHAWKLKLLHPASGQEMEFTAEPGEDFIRASEALGNP